MPTPNEQINEHNNTTEQAIQQDSCMFHNVYRVHNDSTARQTPYYYAPSDTICHFMVEDLPWGIMDESFMDSCKAKEAIVTPEFLAPQAAQKTPEEERWEELRNQLTDLHRTEPVKVTPARTMPSIKTRYAGYEGSSLPQHIKDTVWFTPLMFIIFFICGFVLTMQTKTIKRDSKDFFSFGRRHRDDSSQMERSINYKPILAFVWIISTTLFAIDLGEVDHAGHPLDYQTILLWGIGISTGYLLFKQFITRYLGFVFFGRGAVKVWSDGFMFICSMQALILIPVVLAQSFGPASVTEPLLHASQYAAGSFMATVAVYSAPALLLGSITLILGEILFILYLIAHFLDSKLYFLYLFLYLCTLEILPAIALYIGFSYAIELA